MGFNPRTAVHVAGFLNEKFPENLNPFFFLNLYARVLVGFIPVTSRMWYNIQVFQRVGPLIKTLRVLHAVGEHMTLKKNKKNLLITLINGK